MGTVIGIIVLVVVVVILAGTAVALFYNSLIKVRNYAQNAWAQIDVQLKRRADLVPNLVETVKSYAAHEKEVFESVTKARNMAMGAQTVEQRQEAENILSGALKSLFAVAEAYPQLQANHNYAQLQKDLTETENKIAFSRQFYNDTTMKYNTRIQVFPANFFASLLGFYFIPYFEAVNAVDRDSFKVKF